MLILLFALTAPQAPKPPQAPPVIEQRVFALETKVSWLENDVAALKRDVNAKCDVASKSPTPPQVPTKDCPTDKCYDCKCTVGADCGCRTSAKGLAGDEIIAAAQPVTYREVRTCNGGTCTVRYEAQPASEPEPIYQQSVSSYSSGGCANGQCGVGAAGRVVRGFRLFRRR